MPRFIYLKNFHTSLPPKASLQAVKEKELKYSCTNFKMFFYQKINAGAESKFWLRFSLERPFLAGTRNQKLAGQKNLLIFYLGLKVEKVFLEDGGEGELVEVDRWSLVDTVVDLHSAHLLQGPRPAAQYTTQINSRMLIISLHQPFWRRKPR